MIRTVTGDIQEAACMAAAEGYRLKIYDAYRPQRAVDHFRTETSRLPEDHAGTIRQPIAPAADHALQRIQAAGAGVVAFYAER